MFQEEELLEAQASSHKKNFLFENALYTGGWLNGLPHGKGKLESPNGAYYEGYWRRGVKTGRGKIVDERGGMM